MLYGKLVNGAIEYAPTSLIIGDRTIYNPSSNTLIRAGYKEIVESEIPEFDPEDPKYYKPIYEEEEDKIVKNWVLSDSLITSSTTHNYNYSSLNNIEDRVATLEQQQTEQTIINDELMTAAMELAEMIVGGAEE